MGNLIIIRNLSREYRMGEVRVPALQDIDLEIERGEFIGIVGPSGGGKTTLLNILGGLDRPTLGEVIVDGLDLSRLNDEELSRYRRKKIGIVFQFFNLVPTLSALENVTLPLYLDSYSGSPEGVGKELLSLVGLEKRLHFKPKELSGGEQQRVAIARALVNKPKILLLDEPTGNLDSKNTLLIMNLLKEINQKGQTVVVISHSPTVASYCTRLIEIEDGEVKNQQKRDPSEQPKEEGE